MDDELIEYIRHIHDAPLHGVFHATGGGMQVGAWLVCIYFKLRVVCTTLTHSEGAQLSSRYRL